VWLEEKGRWVVRGWGWGGGVAQAVEMESPKALSYALTN